MSPPRLGQYLAVLPYRFATAYGVFQRSPEGAIDIWAVFLPVEDIFPAESVAFPQIDDGKIRVITWGNIALARQQSESPRRPVRCDPDKRFKWYTALEITLFQQHGQCGLTTRQSSPSVPRKGHGGVIGSYSVDLTRFHGFPQGLHMPDIA